jgi:NTE family protein
MRHPALLLAAFAALIQACVSASVPAALAAETILLDPPVEATTIASLGKSANRDASILTPPTTTSVDSKLTFGDRQRPPRLVLAFSGGGCKSAAQIGVLRSLEKHHIPIDAIVATSMGATIGALYCSGMSVDDIEKLFIEKELQKSILSKVIVNAVISPIKPIAHMFMGKPYAGMSSGKGYYRFLEKNLPATFAELKTPFAAVVTNITDGQTCVLADGDLPRAVLASNAVPTLIRPVMIKGKLYVDGGLRANLPVNVAQSLTTGLIVSVLVDSAIKPEQNKKFTSKNNLVMRVADIVMASSDRQQAKNTDLLIYPDVDFVPGLTQDPVLLKRGILAGEKAADIMAPKIEAALIAEEQATRGIQTSQAMDAIKVVPEAAQTTEVK